ncbi:gamma-glutamylcyclotransferase [Jeotgalibacillus haloalkalitolerans]|uniref:Gamma-glutamylcyclotransferase n=1 Tax=Jeotgalibacillus haloalkalitolerans TaxID=3104292 RepID=A0ABU5KM84_9BACL|nr:gamma-glutamylcyclotransferase [Jeotgalibacillus sp. HH7-29]MDZ5711856.1 gamma-glutamylcyclotransferase [Jeotgalibacillus sp. HH7-29]
MSDLFFVYGTLRKHGSRDVILKNGKLLASQAWTKGKLYLADHLDPILKPDENERSYGELYEVSSEKSEELKKMMSLNGNLAKVTVYTDHLGQQEAYTQTTESDVEFVEEVRFNDWIIHMEMDRPIQYYFAYGSCMDDERFKLAKVDHLFLNKIGGGKVERLEMNYSLSVHDGGRANLIETGGSGEGVLYKVNQKAVEYLYHREGVDSGMYRPAMVDVSVDGIHYAKSITFIVIDPVDEIAPPLHYATEIIRGSRGVVSDEYHEKLVKDLTDKFNLEVKLNK